MITALAGLVDPLKRSLIGSSEVVLHDLSKMPNSIVAISGHLTSRNTVSYTHLTLPTIYSV